MDMASSFESNYDSIHAALRAVMNEGEKGILTFAAFGRQINQGNLDIKRTSAGRIEYVTMPFSRLSRFVRSSTVTSLVVRIFNKLQEGEDVPTKRIYSFVAMDGLVHKLSPEACAEQNCISATGERMSPEPMCEYL